MGLPVGRATGRRVVGEGIPSLAAQDVTTLAMVQDDVAVECIPHSIWGQVTFCFVCCCLFVVYK